MFHRFAFALILALAAAGAAQAAPFQNGGFENGTSPGGSFITLGSGSTAITGWTVTGAGIDYIDGLWTPAEGTRSLDLSAAAAGGISQTFDTVAGHTYQVTFSLAGNPAGGPVLKTVAVQATGGAVSNYTFDTTGTSTAAMGWVSRTYNFTATAAASTLSFTSQDNTLWGPALDNVAITDTTPAAVTPVPTLSEWTLALLVLVMGVVGWRSQRRRVG